MRARYIELFRRMLDPNPRLADAAYDAVLFDREEAVPDLIECYQKSPRDARTRFFTVQLLGFSSAQAAVPTLIAALRDEDEAVRAEACRSLEDLSAEVAIPDIERLLADHEASVREAATDAIQALRATG